MKKAPRESPVTPSPAQINSSAAFAFAGRQFRVTVWSRAASAEEHTGALFTCIRVAYKKIIGNHRNPFEFSRIWLLPGPVDE